MFKIITTHQQVKIPYLYVTIVGRIATIGHPEDFLGLIIPGFPTFARFVPEIAVRVWRV